MLVSLLIFLLLSNAVTIRRDKSILFSRIVTTIKQHNVLGLLLSSPPKPHAFSKLPLKSSVLGSLESPMLGYLSFSLTDMALFFSLFVILYSIVSLILVRLVSLSKDTIIYFLTFFFVLIESYACKVSIKLLLVDLVDNLFIFTALLYVNIAFFFLLKLFAKKRLPYAWELGVLTFITFIVVFINDIPLPFIIKDFLPILLADIASSFNGIISWVNGTIYTLGDIINNYMNDGSNSNYGAGRSSGAGPSSSAGNNTSNSSSNHPPNDNSNLIRELREEFIKSTKRMDRDYKSLVRAVPQAYDLNTFNFLTLSQDQQDEFIRIGRLLSAESADQWSIKRRLTALGARTAYHSYIPVRVFVQFFDDNNGFRAFYRGVHATGYTTGVQGYYTGVQGYTTGYPTNVQPYPTGVQGYPTMGTTFLGLNNTNPPATAVRPSVPNSTNPPTTAVRPSVPNTEYWRTVLGPGSTNSNTSQNNPTQDN